METVSVSDMSAELAGWLSQQLRLKAASHSIVSLAHTLSCFANTQAVGRSSEARISLAIPRSLAEM